MCQTKPWYTIIDNYHYVQSCSTISVTTWMWQPFLYSSWASYASQFWFEKLIVHETTFCWVLLISTDCQPHHRTICENNNIELEFLTNSCSHTLSDDHSNRPLEYFMHIVKLIYHFRSLPSPTSQANCLHLVGSWSTNTFSPTLSLHSLALSSSFSYSL